MRQTLFHFPERLAGVPLFGVGWVLLAVLLAGALVVWRSARENGWVVACRHWLPSWIMAVVVITLILPALERMPPVAASDSLPNHGVPVRGYGVMLFLAGSTAVWWAACRSRRRGVHPERIYQLAVPFFLWGLVGARLAFMLQHWERYEFQGVIDVLIGFVNIAEGGLVVYGSVFGVVIALYLFSRKHRIPLAMLGDIIAPTLLLGLALGRLGCFLNGCCWGGVCDLPWSVRFPQESAAYAEEAGNGLLWGFQLAPDGHGLIVKRVIPRSLAASAGLRANDRIRTVDGQSLAAAGTDGQDQLRLAYDLIYRAAVHLPIGREDGSQVVLERPDVPTHTLPLHPTQLYSTLNALLLLAVVLAYQPLQQRDGQLIALAFTLYPVSRFLLELIRDDEGGLLGTPLTISQWISVIVLCLAACSWWWLGRQPVGRLRGMDPV